MEEMCEDQIYNFFLNPIKVFKLAFIGISANTDKLKWAEIFVWPVRILGSPGC